MLMGTALNTNNLPSSSQPFYQHYSVRLLVRRILSISLLWLFTLPLVAPLFAASPADANVPLCCRRDGKHHCMMGVIARRSSDAVETKTASLHDRCPYDLASAVAIILPFVPDEVQTAVSVATISTSAALPRPAVHFGNEIDRSHRKRGPPSLNLSHS
jgi:hypothetical protein